MPQLARLSKFLALLLRHKAADFGLALDENGFADVTLVWQQIEKRYRGQFSYEDLLRVVAGDESGKKRYEIVDSRIRALFGHSSGVTPVRYPPVAPPEILYHGTTQAALNIIRQQGLKAQRRQYVHFATSVERAQIVAARHRDAIVVLRIRALEAQQAGIVFFHPESEHYLARSLPPQFIDFPAV
ncbi:MAG: RNA 2'-phosphotransferase [Chloroflexi bacterium]|nr:RNA 2'-phosphotransferase [Chloroflexota bacterium]